MSKPSRTEILPDDLLDRQAVRAWAAPKPVRFDPERIEILKLKNKSSVYRLVGVGQGGSSVVAKRCRTATTSVERMMHEEFLPRLPLPALRWYGFVEEPDDDYSWLFLEDAGAGGYLPSCAEHRALAGRWLGATHAAAKEQGLELDALLAVGWAEGSGRPEAAGSRPGLCDQLRPRKSFATASQVLSKATVKLTRWRRRTAYDV